VTRKVSGWLGGQLILGAAIGLSSALWLGLTGVPYFWVLALIAAIGELVPYIGPLLAAVPGIVVALTISPRLALVAAALYFVQQQLESSILAPKILERQVGVSPIVVIIAVLIGSSILGVVGAILAVPTAAILQVLVQELTSDET
jgi:predicted PurR-regulated permease PerM